jgi:hypothetical protein
MAKLNIRCTALIALSLPLLATAAEPPKQPENGAQTRAWLEAQYQSKGDEHTSRAPVPGEVAAKVYQRYVDSFGTSQPAELPRGSFSSGGGSGG